MGAIQLRDAEAVYNGRQRRNWPKYGIAAVALTACLLLARNTSTHPLPELDVHRLSDGLKCPAQPQPIVPGIPFTQADNQTYRDATAQRLGEAVRYESVSYDDNGPVESDPRWKTFADFRSHLFDTFSDVFEDPSVTLETVNTYGILTTVQGSDQSLKPLLLTSHFDVVPVEAATVSRWSHPPFSGAYDGRYVYGRGAADCKSLLMSQYEALRLLLADGFQPRRTVILSHGFDEETTGEQGAWQLSKYLEQRYGRDSMLMLIDEGESSMRYFGRSFAVPATNEKGYIDVKITVGTPGGHSSIPPAHTGIGIMAEAIHAVEAHPFLPSFAGTQDPILQFLACAEENAPKFPEAWRDSMRKQDYSKLAEQFAAFMPEAQSLITTTQAATVITGGQKVNALPEYVTAVINHRIAFKDSIKSVQSHIAASVAGVAKQYGLKLYAFDAPANTSQWGDHYLALEDLTGLAFDPADNSPTLGPVWDLLAGSVRHVLKEASGEPYIVSPFASTGNTDTGRYTRLVKDNAIYRYVGAGVSDGPENEHTVDERVSIRNHIETIHWIHTIIQNADSHNDS